MILGLTGGIASGKSTVSAYLQQKNIPVIDADKISHKVTVKGSKGAKAILKEFGEEFFVFGRLDRQKLGTYCFNNEERTQALNSILHPLIVEEMLLQTEAAKKTGAKIIVLDVPLLFEANLTHLCDKVLVVVCDTEKRVDRAVKRGLPREDVLSRINRQVPDSVRTAQADFVLDNNGSMENTLKQMDNILKEIENEC